MSNNELYHHGILGMRWGVRRTPAQLGRRSSGNNSNEKLTTKNKVAKPETSTSSGRSSSGRKSVSEMSNDELNNVIKRMELEKRYRDLNPKTVSKGKKFVNTVMDKVIIPASTEAGKQLFKDYLIKTGNEKLGIKSNNDKNK